MVFKPAHLEVNQHAIDPNDISKGLDFSGVCGWVGKYKGDPKYSGLTCKDSLKIDPSFDSELNVILDNVPANGGNMYPQLAWINYFNGRNEFMASMGDIYLAGKSNDQQVLAGLREDFKEWMLTSTRIKYDDENNARIIHHYRSKLIEAVEHKVIIPEYRAQLLEEVLDTKEGLRFLQVLFETNDSASQMINILHNLSYRSSDLIKVWSTDIVDRPTERAVSLGYNAPNLFIQGDCGAGSIGRARGVRIK